MQRIDMNNPVLYFLCLLVMTVAASMMAAAAQENSSATWNNATQEDSDWDNESLNISVTNNTIINDTTSNATNSTSRNSTNNATFKIGGDMKFRQSNSSRIHIVDGNSETQAPERASFMINGYVRPIRDAVYEGQYLLNAAGLSRAVEGTPHGYVTYHN
jgi:archaellum component FlaG (FlaF/FlaG flagellin family)